VIAHTPLADSQQPRRFAVRYPLVRQYLDTHTRLPRQFGHGASLRCGDTRRRPLPRLSPRRKVRKSGCRVNLRIGCRPTHGWRRAHRGGRPRRWRH
jgi:hypothetical protein